MRSERTWGIWVLTFNFENGGEFPLYELATWINGIAFRDINFTQKGMPVIKIAEMKSGISESTGLTMNQFDKKYLITSGDLLFSWSGSPKTSIFPLIWQGPDGWLNQHIFKVIPKEGISQEFLHLLLIWLNHELIFLATNRMTTGLGHVTKSDLQRLKVNLPKKKDREKIVKMTYPLLSLESELNRISEANELTLNCLFKSWFIDFEPVKAKAEGKLPYGMDDETAALFADSFKDSKHGILPNGWRWGTILDLSKIWTGGTPKTSESSYWGGDIPWVSGADLSSNDLFAFDSERKITSLGVEKSSTKVLPVGTVMITARGTVGATKITAVPMAMSQTSFGFKAKKGISDALVYLASQETIRQLRSFAYGAVFDTFTQSTIDITKIAIAPLEILQAFGKIVDPLFETMKNSAKTEINLATTRDALLPRMMSGELKVN